MLSAPIHNKTFPSVTKRSREYHVYIGRFSFGSILTAEITSDKCRGSISHDIHVIVTAGHTSVSFPLGLSYWGAPDGMNTLTDCTLALQREPELDSNHDFKASS